MENDFTVPIRGDTKDLLSKLRDAGLKLNSFGKTATEAVRAPQAELANLNASLSSFGSVAKTALAGIIGGIGIKSLTKDFMDYHANLSNAVQVMGYDVTQVEALGGAMRRFGGNTQGAVSSLDNLTSALQQARYGQGALVETASKYGIQFMKSNGALMSSEELLQSLSSQLNKFDKQTKRAIASQLGLDNALLRVIDSGNYDSMIASQKKLNTTTQQDLKIATDLESAWLDFKDSIGSVVKEISRVLLPVLTKLMKSMTAGLQYLKDWKGTGTLAFASLGVAMIPVVSKATAFVGALKSLSMVTGIMKGIQTALGGISTAMSLALSPIGLIALAFIGIFLVVEDLYTYFKGGDSIFGDLAKEYPIVQSFLDGLGRAIDSIKTGVSTVIDFFRDPSWEKLTAILETLKEKAVAVFSYLGEVLVSILTKPFESVSGMFSDATSWISDKAGSGWDAVKGWFSSGSKEAPAITSTPAGVLSKGDAPNGMIDNKQVSINNDITINAPNASGEQVATIATQTTDKLNKVGMAYQDK